MSILKKASYILLAGLTICGFSIGIGKNYEIVNILGRLLEKDTVDQLIGFTQLIRLTRFYNLLMIMFFVVCSLSILLLINNNNIRKKIQNIERELYEVKNSTNI